MPVIRFNSFYKNLDGDLVGVDDEGKLIPYDDWTTAEISAARKAADWRGKPLHSLPSERVWRIADNDDVPHDGDESGDGDPDDAEDGEPVTGDEGTGSEGEGAESDEQPDEDEPLDFSGTPKADTSGLESDLLQDIWKELEPLVIETAELRDQFVYTSARIADRRYGHGGGHGGGNGGTTKVYVSKVEAGDIPTLRHIKFDKVLAAVARGRHVYLPGPPGTGKSHIIKQIAAALGKPVHIDSFSPHSTESKLFGFVDAQGKVVETGYRRAFLGGWIYGGDELDNANPAIVTGLNSGLANGMSAFPDGTYEMHPDFVMIATANTLGTGPTAEFAGRQKLDPATLNRFVKIYIDTDEAMETAIVSNILGDEAADKWLSKVRHVRRAVEAERIKHFVTMRDSINGAHLIAPGDGKFTIAEALEMTCLGVLTEEQQHKIKTWRG